MTNYLDYIRGGEFLIAPSLDYKDQYILKCCECEEYYDQLETLFSHCIGHYQSKSNEVDCSLDAINDDSDDLKDSSLKSEHFVESEGEVHITAICSVFGTNMFYY